MNFWTIKAKSADEIEFTIYGEIADSKWWDDDVTPKGIKEELDKYPDAKEMKIFY